MTSARSLAAMLGLGVTISVAGFASPADAHVVPGCRNTTPQAMNPHCRPGHNPDAPDDGDDGGDADGDNVLDGGVRRADTGFGGSSGTGSETTILLVGGGVLALGAAFGVRRARGTKA